MQIISIKKDRKHLTRIKLSNGEEISLDNDVIYENNLTEYDEICAEDIERLSLESDYKRARSRALWYLDRMDYSEKTLYDKLVKAGFSKKASAMVLEKLVDIGAVDDNRFAERLAERYTDSNISKREALQKMLLKGIPLDLAKEVLNNTEVDEEVQIKALLEGKYAYKLTCEKGSERVFAALIRKGFSYSAVRSSMKEYLAQQEFCEGN